MKLPAFPSTSSGNASALANRRILVTRPARQARELCRLIEAAGGQAMVFPLLEIVPAANPSELAALPLQDYDLAIFVSVNAVEMALPHLPRLPPLAVAAVGEGTAKALRQAGWPPSIVPERQFDSEGLLALAELQADRVAGKKVLIFRGEGGREALAEGLRQRGAEVEYVEVYQRRLPRVDPALHPWIERGGIDVIVITSSEGLRNLPRLLNAPAWLFGTTLLLGSERIRQAALDFGFHGSIMAAPQMSDAGLLQGLFGIYQSRS
jgi:uroporphyrinogen-III synthase